MKCYEVARLPKTNIALFNQDKNYQMYQLTKLDQPEEPMEEKISNPEKITKISITNAKTRVKKMEV